MNKIGSLTILFLLVTAISYGDDISISADVDSHRIALNEQLTLTITVSGNISNIPKPQIPSLDGFTAYSSGRSQNISIINGQVTSSVSFTYILVPNDTGKYNLGPFTVTYGGKTYSAGPIEVEVIAKTPQRQQQVPSYTQPWQSAPPSSGEGYREASKRPEKELFIETYVDKLTAYVNEQITLTFAFYQSVDLFENPVYNPPSTTGFWTEDMPPQKKYYKVIDGRRYLVTEIKTALFATAPGEFTIGSARLEASVEDLERFFSRSPFDIFDRDPFSMFRRGKPIVLTTDPIIIDILPLPDKDKPLNFKGDVGSFDISAAVDKNTVEENQPISLKIKIKGEGNIKTISSPDMPKLDNVKFYDSGSSENISKDNHIVQGEKIFEKVIIPKEKGKLNIGYIEYSYFDPVTKRYVTKKTNPIDIEVTESKESTPEAPVVPFRGLTKEEVKLLKKDIAYIKTSPIHLKPPNRFLYKNKIFLSVHIFSLFILLFLYLFESHKKRLRTDIRYARSRRARRIASKRLKEARAIMQKEDVKRFYREIYRAVIEYIADKLNIPHPSITKDLLEERLEKKGFSKEIIIELKELFDICDMARFAPYENLRFCTGQASGRFTKENMQNSLREATDVIAELERLG